MQCVQSGEVVQILDRCPYCGHRVNFQSCVIQVGYNKTHVGYHRNGDKPCAGSGEQVIGLFSVAEQKLEEENEFVLSKKVFQWK